MTDSQQESGVNTGPWQFECKNSHQWTDDEARRCPVCDASEVYLIHETGEREAV